MYAIFKHRSIDGYVIKIESGLTREKAEAMAAELTEYAERSGRAAEFGLWYEVVDQDRL